MSDARFSSAWLRLREPFDHAARAGAAAGLAVPERLAPWRAGAGGGPLAVLDLACGSGANLRALAPLLGGVQRWRLVDHDPLLLAAVGPALADWARAAGHRFTAAADGRLQVAGAGFDATITCERHDLARGLASLAVGAGTLVTASALLDLVSAAWLARLIERARDGGAALLFALSVDGRIGWQPDDPDDAPVQRLFEQHQHRDKGFGPALGPQAVPSALESLARAGWRVAHAPSDWVIDGAQDPAMLRALIEGTAEAARQQDPSAQARVQAWQARRLGTVGATRLRVGHVDLVATPD